MPSPTVMIRAKKPTVALTEVSRMSSGVIMTPRFTSDSPRLPWSTAPTQLKYWV